MGYDGKAMCVKSRGLRNGQEDARMPELTLQLKCTNLSEILLQTHK